MLLTGDAMQFFNFYIWLRLNPLRTVIFTIVERHFPPIHPLDTLSARARPGETQNSIGLWYFTLVLQYIYDGRLSADHRSHLIITALKRIDSLQKVRFLYQTLSSTVNPGNPLINVVGPCDKACEGRTDAARAVERSFTVKNKVRAALIMNG